MLLSLCGLWLKGDLARDQEAHRQTAYECGVTNWVRFSPPGGGFSILMPFQPSAMITTNDTAAGQLVMTQFTAEPSTVVAFSVLQNRFPAKMNVKESKRLFDGGLKGALGADGRLISDSSISLRGHAGRDWRFEKFKGKALISMRVYLVDHEFYQTACVMPKSRACPKHIQEFLDSFDLSRSE